MRSRLLAAVPLGVVVATALAVRLAGITSGLPFAYNPDEELHFVPQAAAAADGHLDPGYYQNPSGLTYLLAAVFRIVFVGRDVTELLEQRPGAVFLAGRLVVAALGVLLVVLAHWAGARFFGRAAGLGAAAFLAVGFLPVHYSRQALNDVPTAVAVTVVLGAAVALYDRGGWRDCLLAGAAVGAAAGTKYTAAPVALAVAVAVLARVLDRREERLRALGLLAASGAVCVVVFALLNPFVLLRPGAAGAQLAGQSDLASTGKLGQSGEALTFYPGSLLWGLGAVPVVLAVLGLVLALREGRGGRVRAVLLVVFPIVLYAYLARPDRFFARWVLPAYPAVAILAGHGLARAVRWARGRTARLPAWSAPALVLAVAFAQPLADTLHNVTVVTRTDTRTQALGWIEDHLGDGDRMVVEPSLPRGYLAGTGVEPYPLESPFERYEAGLRPGLAEAYRAQGYCWVLVTSHQRDRGRAAGLANAAAYYADLAQQADARAVFSPYDEGAEAPPFSYDFSFDWYPRAYERPGPSLELFQLRDC